MWFWSEDELAAGYSRAKAELAAGKRLRTSFFIYHRDPQRFEESDDDLVERLNAEVS